MLVAGIETPYLTLEWAMSLLLNHPNTMKKIKNEIDTHVGTERLLQENDLERLSYLQNVINESLRLYPTLPMLLPREASQDTKIGGYFVPSGTMLMVNAWAIQRDPVLWDKPDEFMPERFEGRSDDKYKMLAFGQFDPIQAALAAIQESCANILLSKNTIQRRFSIMKRGEETVNQGLHVKKYTDNTPWEHFDVEVVKRLFEALIDRVEPTLWELGLKTGVGTPKENVSRPLLSVNLIEWGHLPSTDSLKESWRNKRDGDDETYEDCVGDMVGVTDSPQITLNALSGLNSYQTMRVRGRVGKQVVHILIDCGSTHNFLDIHTAKKLGCRLAKTTPMQVSVANGQRMMSTSWLATLGDMQCNFKKLIMKFNHKGRQLVLRGMNNTHVHWMQGNEGMLKQAELSSMALCVYPVQLCQMESVGSVSAEVEQVLTQFDEVFEVPKDLPPQRSHDHQIPLMLNTPPINVRPYRHPPNQKDAIEGMVKELMDSGVIRASQSPFSSPIVMVKKKDGT
ncbi:retrotransposable element Tf2 [Tanacetum coccineum]